LLQTEFTHQVDRLKSSFGEKNYPAERIKILWDELRHQDAAWMNKVVTRLIGESRFPPLLPEFRDALAIQRERGWNTEKQQMARSASEAFRMWESGECGMPSQTIRNRVLGLVSDEDWAAFVSVVKNIS